MKATTSKKLDRDPMEVTCDAFCVVLTRDRRWEPLKLRIEDGIVVSRERVSLDAHDYPQIAYQHAANACAENAAADVAKLMAERKCKHPEPTEQAKTGPRVRYVEHCELCSALKDSAGRWCRA